MLDNCFRFAPRDSIPGLIAKICKYLKDHPGWSEEELEDQIKKFISAAGGGNIVSVNGKTGVVELSLADIVGASGVQVKLCTEEEFTSTTTAMWNAYYKEGYRIIGVVNSAATGIDYIYLLKQYENNHTPIGLSAGASGAYTPNNPPPYPVSKVNGKTGSVDLKVVDVSNGNSRDENAYIFIDENENYDDVIASDSNKLGGQLPSYYATYEEVSKLRGDIGYLGNTGETKAGAGKVLTTTDDGTEWKKLDEEWELVESITFSEPVTTVIKTFAHEYKKISILASVGGAEWHVFKYVVDGGNVGQVFNSQKRYRYILGETFGDTIKSMLSVYGQPYALADVNINQNISSGRNIKGFEWLNCKFEAGVTMQIRGVRA